jgi:hypothetical protein
MATGETIRELVARRRRRASGLDVKGDLTN